MGFILAATAGLWGLARFFEENVFLRQNDHNGAPLVQGAGLALFIAGSVAMVVLWRRHRGDPVPVPDPVPQSDPDDDEPVVDDSSHPEDSAVEV